MLGGTIASRPVAAQSTAGQRSQAALLGVTPEQIAQAKIIEQKAREMGSPVTGFEAIQAVTGANPKMQVIQRNAEGSDYAANTLTPIMQNRPKANSVMFNKQAERLSPAEQFPDVLAGLLQDSASGVLRDARKARASETKPFYENQRNSDLEALQLPREITKLDQQIKDGTWWKNDAVQQAGKNYANNNFYNNKANDLIKKNLGFIGQKGVDKFLARADESKQATIEAVNEARRRQDYIDQWTQQKDQKLTQLEAKNLPILAERVGDLLTKIDQNIQVVGANSLEGKTLTSLKKQLQPQTGSVYLPSAINSAYKTNRELTNVSHLSTPEQRMVAGVIGPYVSELKAISMGSSENIAKGSELHRNITKDVVRPLEVSQIGKIAGSPDNLQTFSAQANNLLPENPLDITPSVINRTIDAINQQDPNITRRFLAQYLRGTFNEANQKNMGGDNVFGGAKFAAKIAGNPTQEQNLMAALLASGGDSAGINNALEVFRAQGFKPSSNSATAANLQEMGAQNAAGFMATLLRGYKAAPYLHDKLTGSLSNKELASALSAGDGSIDRLMELARTGGKFDPIQQQMLINLLLANQKTQGEK